MKVTLSGPNAPYPTVFEKVDRFGFQDIDDDTLAYDSGRVLLVACGHYSTILLEDEAEA